MRQSDWKLLLERDGSDPQLYDLQRDPSETNNLAATEPDVLQRMRAPLLAWWASLPGTTTTTPQRHANGRVFANPIAEGADPWMVLREGRG